MRHKKHIIGDNEEYGIYSAVQRDVMLDDDELAPEEHAFMCGYDDEFWDADQVHSEL